MSDSLYRDLLQPLLAAAVDIDDSMAGNIQVYDPGTAQLRIVAQQGFHEPFLRHFETVSAFDGSACGQSLAERRRILVQDTATDVAFAPHAAVAEAAGFRSVLSLPLTGVDGSLLGVMSTHWAQPHQPSALASRQLGTLTQLAALVLESLKVIEQAGGGTGDVALSPEAELAAAGAMIHIARLSKRGFRPNVVDSAIRYMTRVLPTLRRDAELQ